jgi:hypothetical protein
MAVGARRAVKDLPEPSVFGAFGHARDDDYRKRLRTPGRNGAVGVRTGGLREEYR